jgi:hypothetical protein
MKKEIWFRNGSLGAKAVWVLESKSGVYIGPSVGLKQVHYSYHPEGQRHLASGPAHYGQKNDTKLDAVTEHGNVGGFQIEFPLLDWKPMPSVGKKHVVIEYDPATRSDLPLIVSLHVCAESSLASFREKIRSGGAVYKDICVPFDLVRCADRSQPAYSLQLPVL